MGDGAGQPPHLSDGEFVDALRTSVENYLAAVDQWDAAYQKYYRLPGFASRISDLAAEQQVYDARRRELERMLPRARRLCLKHAKREPFSGLLRISLGVYAPQERAASTIGRNERSVVTRCLVELHDACREWSPAETEAPQPKQSLLRRVVNYFF